MTLDTPRPLKDYKTYKEQIDLLRERGMTVEDTVLAAKWLQEVGYYRLSLYAHHFRNADDRGRKQSHFRDGTTFEELVSLYVFDRELRYRVFSGIEKIEVALRARMGYLLGSYGPDVHMTPGHFRSSRKHAELLRTFERRFSRALAGNDEIALHHQAHYGGQLPFWVLTDLLDFSDLSKLFSQLHSTDQRHIARGFSLNDPPRKRKPRPSNLAGWLHQLSLVRNFTAHHARLWDRAFGAKGVTDAQGVNGYFQGVETPAQSKDMYGVLTIMAFLLNAIEDTTDWAQEMAQFIDTSFQQLPSRSLAEMGIPADWRTQHPWALPNPDSL